MPPMESEVAKESEDFVDREDNPITQTNEEEEKKKKISALTYSSNPSNSITRYENTYRMEPTKIFFSDKAAEIIKSVLVEALEGKSYNFKVFSELTSVLSDRIKEKVKEKLNIPRYKLVSFVTVGQAREQGVRIGSRCVWSPAVDRHASSSYKNQSIFAVGVVYAAYYE